MEVACSLWMVDVGVDYLKVVVGMVGVAVVVSEPLTPTLTYHYMYHYLKMEKHHIVSVQILWY